MEDAKSLITESRDTVNELLNAPDATPMEKIQYKVMAINLNTMLSIVNWLQNMRQPQKTR